MPIRPILEALGATIDWDAKNNTAIISKDNIKISLPIGKQYAYRNNQKINLKVAATVKNGYTMVPVRFISESLGAKVDWDSASRTVYISK